MWLPIWVAVMESRFDDSTWKQMSIVAAVVGMEGTVILLKGTPVISLNVFIKRVDMCSEAEAAVTSETASVRLLSTSVMIVVVVVVVIVVIVVVSVVVVLAPEVVVAPPPCPPLWP